MHRHKVTCDGLLLLKNDDKCAVFDGECLVLLYLRGLLPLESRLLQNLSSRGSTKASVQDSPLLERAFLVSPKKAIIYHLPEDYCVVTRDHHLKDYDSKNYLLVLVRLADIACLKLGIGLTKDESIVLSTREEAQHLNLTEIDLAELEIFLEDTAIGAG